VWIIVENCSDGGCVAPIRRAQERCKARVRSRRVRVRFQLRPILKATFPRECVLHITQRWICRRARIRAAQAVDCAGVTVAK
jgi:hypothetical protein